MEFQGLKKRDYKPVYAYMAPKLTEMLPNQISSTCQPPLGRGNCNALKLIFHHKIKVLDYLLPLDPYLLRLLVNCVLDGLVELRHCGERTSHFGMGSGVDAGNYISK